MEPGLTDPASFLSSGMASHMKTAPIECLGLPTTSPGVPHSWMKMGITLQTTKIGEPAANTAPLKVAAYYDI